MPASPLVLCRLNLPEQAGDPETIDAVLRRHLRHAKLANVLIHINGRLQPYVLTEGCSGCATQSCAIGCYRELLHRGLRSIWGAAVEMKVVTKLIDRPYTRHVAVIPGKEAAPLPPDLPANWPDSRLVVGWSATNPGIGKKAKKKKKDAPEPPQTAIISVGAALDVGDDGPDPQEALAAHGWIPAPRLTDRLPFNVPLPNLPFLAGDGGPALRFPAPRMAWSGHIFLLTGQSVAVES
jgi:hypothetical protein